MKRYSSIVYTNHTSNGYLAHHGILGQKWGHKNGPPYPLDASDHSASEKKAGWTKSLDRDSATGQKRKGLTDKQKKLVIAGSIAVASAIAIYGGYKLYQAKAIPQPFSSQELKDMGISVFEPDRIDVKRTDILGGIEDIIKPPKNGFSDEAIKQAVEGINPTHSKTNCGSTSVCSIYNLFFKDKVKSLPEVPLEMRSSPGSRGYDPEKLISCFKNAKWKSIDGLNRRQKANNLEKELLSFGNGASGIFFCDKLTTRPYGHYFSWTISDGKLIIPEGQIGHVYSNNFYDDIGHILDPESRLRYARLDKNGTIDIVEGMEKYLFMQ